MLKKYKRLSELVNDLKNGIIPENVVSPGAAAKLLGVTRQSINDRLHKSGSLDAWSADGVILISVKSVLEARNKKLNIPAGQGELNVGIQ